MKKRLINIALFTSPLIAVYGLIPLFIFDRITVFQLVSFSIFVTLNVLFFWAVNIFLVIKYPHWKSIKRNIISFLAIFISRIPFVLLNVINGVPDFLEEIFEDIVFFPFYSLVLINIIILIIIDSIKSSIEKSAALKKVDKLSIQNLEAQKQTLIQQIQPHFLFNALSTLKSLIGENAKEAEKYTVKLSKFLRYSFTDNSNGLTTLEKELTFTKDYIQLQTIRFGEAFNYTIDIPATAINYQIPVFALQTLVENIFKHNHFSEKQPIEFSIRFENDHLIIWNKKAGIKSTDSNRTGLTNLNKRYELIKGEGIIIENNKTDFRVTLPLLKA